MAMAKRLLALIRQSKMHSGRSPAHVWSGADEGGSVLRRSRHAHPRDWQNAPKPMVTIGYRPILWHVMKYYAHYGHTDFVLCLGYRGDVIKNYFLNYSEASRTTLCCRRAARRSS